jgi:hypothetical protein
LAILRLVRPRHLRKEILAGMLQASLEAAGGAPADKGVRRTKAAQQIHKWLFTGITAADLINDRVVPFYDAREVRPSRVLTNRGRSVAAIQNTGNTNSIWRSRISTIGAPSSRAQKRMKFHKRSVPMASSCSLIRQLKADCALRICSTGSGRDDEQPKTQ